MTTELYLLIASVILGLVQIGLSAAATTHQRGLKWNLSARDEPQAPLTGIASRLDRASSNFKETFPLAATLILVAHLLNVHTTQTVLGCQLYFWGRVVYLPLYAFGVPVVRSVVWCATIAGLIMLITAVATTALV